MSRPKLSEDVVFALDYPREEGLGPKGRGPALKLYDVGLDHRVSLSELNEILNALPYKDKLEAIKALNGKVDAWKGTQLIHIRDDVDSRKALNQLQADGTLERIVKPYKDFQVDQGLKSLIEKYITDPKALYGMTSPSSRDSFYRTSDGTNILGDKVPFDKSWNAPIAEPFIDKVVEDKIKQIILKTAALTGSRKNQDYGLLSSKLTAFKHQLEALTSRGDAYARMMNYFYHQAYMHAFTSCVGRIDDPAIQRQLQEGLQQEIGGIQSKVDAITASFKKKNVADKKVLQSILSQIVADQKVKNDVVLYGDEKSTRDFINEISGLAMDGKHPSLSSFITRVSDAYYQDRAKDAVKRAAAEGKTNLKFDQLVQIAQQSAAAQKKSASASKRKSGVKVEAPAESKKRKAEQEETEIDYSAVNVDAFVDAKALDRYPGLMEALVADRRGRGRKEDATSLNPANKAALKRIIGDLSKKKPKA